MSEPTEKRSVPVTVWITEAERAWLEDLRQRTGRSIGGLQVTAVKPACFTRDMVLLGLRAFEQSLGKSESFPAHSPPAGKMQRRARGSGKATNVIKLKQSA